MTRALILLLTAPPRQDGQKQFCSSVGEIIGGKLIHQQLPVPDWQSNDWLHSEQCLILIARQNKIDFRF